MFGLSALATKLILGGILAASLLAGALYIKHVIAQNAVLSSQLDQSVATNKANQVAYDKLKAAADKATAALTAQHLADVARLQQDAALLQRIANAKSKPGQDAPAAPVLSDLLGSLQNGSPANPSAGGANPNP